MSPLPTVFVSFSSRDIEHVRELFFGLKSQESLDVWDYSDEVQALELSQSVYEQLQPHIDGCDLFVAVVSPHSTSDQFGRITRWEVARALERNKEIVAIVLDKDRVQWTDSYASLREPIYFPASPDLRHMLDAAQRVCGKLGVEYQTPVRTLHRFPLRENFQAELKHHEFADAWERRHNHQYFQLMSALNRFYAAFQARHWGRAETALRYFGILEDTYLDSQPGTGLIYPSLALVMCLRLQGKFTDAHALLQRLERQAPDLCHVHTSLGFLAFDLDQPDQARRELQLACELAPPDNRREERFNLLAARLSDERQPGALSGEERLFVRSLCTRDKYNAHERDRFRLCLCRDAFLRGEYNELQRLANDLEVSPVEKGTQLFLASQQTDTAPLIEILGKTQPMEPAAFRRRLLSLPSPVRATDEASTTEAWRLLVRYHFREGEYTAACGCMDRMIDEQRFDWTDAGAAIQMCDHLEQGGVLSTADSALSSANLARELITGALLGPPTRPREFRTCARLASRMGWLEVAEFDNARGRRGHPWLHE